jgi:hypothetical protein
MTRTWRQCESLLAEFEGGHGEQRAEDKRHGTEAMELLFTLSPHFVAHFVGSSRSLLRSRRKKTSRSWQRRTPPIPTRNKRVMKLPPRWFIIGCRND